MGQPPVLLGWAWIMHQFFCLSRSLVACFELHRATN
jgi:hypothetical protein